ncbi:MAG: DUF1499 domain-containing protein [Nitrococcus sp.]|nr:DUF1499 domain-containing protein [Nitrococcus sp.]
MPDTDYRRGMTRRSSRAGCWIAGIGLLLALIGAALVALPGPGYRWQQLALAEAFTLLRWGAWIGLAGAVFSLLAILLLLTNRGGRSVPALLAGVGLAIGGVSFGLPWALLQQARSVPPIHDITTDTANPPVFRAILPLRRGAPNPARYGGPSIARKQHQAYPDIRPLHFQVSPERAFAAALEVAKELGWRIVAATPEAGRIEATATTFWFGFKDDVVIRIRDMGRGTRVDIRSVSRVGRSDVGKNAERIQRFSAQLTRILSGASAAAT